MNLRIGIDARWIFPRISGIGRVTEKLIPALGELDRENRYFLFFFQPELKEKYYKNWERYHNFESVLVPWPIFSTANQLKMPLLLRRLQLDVFHSPNYFIPLLAKKPKMVITIHDLIPLKFPHFTPRAKKTRYNFLFRWIMRRCVRRADAVIAVSHHTRDDLVQCLGVKREKIAVVHNGVDSRYRPLDPETIGEVIREKWDLSAPYILFVGRFDPYKNLIGLIRAFKIFAQSASPDTRLVIAGHHDPRYPEAFKLVRDLGLDSRVTFLDGLDEDDLIYLYNGALVLVLPSFYEGFGLPPLEAMACGTPVICSNRGALPEVVGEAAVVIDPGSEGEIARALSLIRKDEKLRHDLRVKGLDRARGFSWRGSAEGVLAVYRELGPS